MSRFFRRLSRSAAKRFEGALALVLRALPKRSFLRLKERLSLVERLDYERAPIWLHIESLVEHDLRLLSCRKEPDTVAWLEQSLQPGDVLYDVGANVGAYSLIAAKHGEGKVSVYAFEPAFQSFAQLCRNVHLNDCDEAVAALPIALSDATGVESFYYRKPTAGAAHHALREPVDERGQRFRAQLRQAVLSYRLDDLIPQLSLPAPTHLKVDVDGLELAVLRGAAQTLAGPTVRGLVVELEEGDREREVCAFLSGVGFELEAKHPRWLEGVCNCIFARSAPR